MANIINIEQMQRLIAIQIKAELDQLVEDVTEEAVNKYRDEIRKKILNAATVLTESMYSVETSGRSLLIRVEHRDVK